MGGGSSSPSFKLEPNSWRSVQDRQKCHASTVAGCKVMPRTIVQLSPKLQMSNCRSSIICAVISIVARTCKVVSISTNHYTGQHSQCLRSKSKSTMKCLTNQHTSNSLYRAEPDIVDNLCNMYSYSDHSCRTRRTSSTDTCSQGWHRLLCCMHSNNQRRTPGRAVLPTKILISLSN